MSLFRRTSLLVLISNFRATGVTTQTVEDMEIKLKRDVLREVRKNEGRILLHDEVEERPGVFTILPQWEVVAADDILTPRDVFELMAREGYKVSCVFRQSVRC